MRTGKIDKIFLAIVIGLTAIGFLVFTSASLGLLTRSGATFSSVALSQIIFGLGFGGIFAAVAANANYKLWRKYSFFLFIFSIIATLLVFVPHLGFASGGAKRWIVIFGYSFQPSELLKIGFIVYFASWCSWMRDKISIFKYGMIPLIAMLGIVGAVLLAQPDTDTFLIMFCAAVAMYWVGGGKFRHLLILAAIGFLCVAVLAFFRPYVMQRITTFINPADDPQGASYQIQQSLIAIGSGQAAGRGFGQSIQKFNYLPEPIGDSIFAVAGEEFGFIGSVILVLLFVLFALRALKIASRSPDMFGKLLIVGIVVMTVSQAFINIASMLGIIPLSGIPLPFVSHGGTAMMFSLIGAGIILNISKYQKI